MFMKPSLLKDENPNFLRTEEKCAEKERKKRPGGYSHATLNTQVPTMKKMHAREKTTLGYTYVQSSNAASTMNS
jgi:hypothetical protein